MALFIKTEASEKQKIMSDFSGKLFEISDYIGVVDSEYIVVEFSKIQSLLSTLAELNHKNKLEICSRASNLTVKDCEDLKAIVTAEEHLRNLQPLLSSKDMEAADRYSYFFQLVSFLSQSKNQWQDRPHLIEEISACLHYYADVLRKEHDILSEKILLHWRTGEICTDSKKYALLRSLKLMEKIIEVFENNNQKLHLKIEEFSVDPKIQYFSFEGI